MKRPTRSRFTLPRGSAFALLAIAVVATAVGCDRNVSPYVEGEEPREPDLSRIFPETGEHDHAEDAASDRTSVAQETSRTGSARGPTISGEIRLVDGAEAPAGATLFVIARTAGAQGGPPLAVLRVPSPAFPFAFELSQTNVMIPSLRFDGEMDVSARLDGDGNAMTKAESDLNAISAEGHRPGDSGLVLTLK